MSLTTVVVYWRGPYTLEEVWELVVGNGIYLLAGKKRYERETQIHYCGITESLFASRISDRHHALREIREDTLEIWLGQVHFPSRFGRRHLEIAEHCFVYFWQPALNTQKTAYCPSEPICLISQWFTRSGDPRLRRPAIIKDLPDVLWWDAERWRTGQLRVGSPEE